MSRTIVAAAVRAGRLARDDETELRSLLDQS
jgi:hypothetical protein